MPLRRRSSLLVVALSLTVTACGSARAASRDTGASETLGGVGVLPAAVAAPVAEARQPVAAAATARPAATTSAAATSTTGTPTTGTSTTTTTVAAATSEVTTTTQAAAATLKAISPVGERATGNRILLIGDSIMAGTSSRYSNDMCKALVPLGWNVEVDAEVGRFIDFADRVLDRRLAAGWDAAVIFLGSNFGDNQSVYASMLEEQVERLSPRPVVLVTVTEFKPTRADVNAAIRLIAFNHPNVSVVDWAAITAASPEILSGDDLHPTPQGRQVLAMNIAAAVGEAPTQPGSCIKPAFRDDSAGSVVTGTTAPRTQTTTKRNNPTQTTTRSTTKPTTAPTNKPAPTTAVAPTPTATTPKTNPPTTPDAPKPTEPKPTNPPTSPASPTPTSAGG